MSVLHEFARCKNGLNMSASNTTATWGARIRPLSAQQRGDLYVQLAALEDAGLPRAQAVGLARVAGVRRFPDAVRELQAQLLSGSDIATAGEHCGLFSGFDVALLRAALAGGDLANTYRRLAEHYAARARRIRAVKSRLVLPAAVLMLSLFIQPLPDMVLGRIDAFAYLRLSVFRLLQIGFAAYLLFRIPGWLREGFLQPLKPHADLLRLRLPLFGKMNQRRNLRDFFAALGLLLEAGVPMAEGAAKALDTMHNRHVREGFTSLPGTLAGGRSLTEALKALPFPGSPEAMQLISAGEVAGRLPEMLRRHCAREDEAIDGFDTQVAEWLPRLVYAAVIAMLASAVLSSGAFMPSADRLP
jgi:type II secretory pathway component PulF